MENTQTLLTCYQQPDEDTLRRVLDEPRKLRDRGLDGDDLPGAARRRPRRSRNGARNGTWRSWDEERPRTHFGCAADR